MDIDERIDNELKKILSEYGIIENNISLSLLKDLKDYVKYHRNKLIKSFKKCVPEKETSLQKRLCSDTRKSYILRGKNNCIDKINDNIKDKFGKEK